MSQINLFLDFETRSRVSLKERGLDNYLSDVSSEPIMMSWCINNSPVELWLAHAGSFPEHLRLLIERPEVTKIAFNCPFEVGVFEKLLGIKTPFRSWVDVMVMARYASIAGNLEFVGKILGLENDEAKLKTGKQLIKLFCSPNRKNEFEDHLSQPEKFGEFCEYARRDTEATRTLFHRLKAFQLPPFEQKIFELDYQINHRGLPVDMTFVRNASKIVEEERAALTKEFVELTSLDNPNSVKQLLGWVKTKGYPYGSLGAKWVKKALANPPGFDVDKEGYRGLELRQLLAKSSTAKLEALANLTGPDGMLRYQYVYGGAARTLRWSGRGFQPQNLPRPTIKKIEEAIEAILTGDREKVRAFGPPLEVVASCLRGALRAA